LVDSPFWQATESMLVDLSTPGAHVLREVARKITPAAAGTVQIGAWHGDWHPSNMAVVGGRLLVWDWERFALGVPVGCDALHFEMQQAIYVAKATPREAVTDLVVRAPRLLSPLGVASADATLVTAAYLLHLGARYLRDDQARFGPVEEWLLPTVVELAGSLAPAQSTPSRGPA
jgi:hypothetical protein